MKARGKAGVAESRASWDAVRRVLHGDPVAADLSSEETAMLVSQLTDLVGRVDRVRAMGPAFADISVSQNVQDLLARLEVGSGLETGVH